MPEQFDPVLSVEPIDLRTVNMIALSMGMIPAMMCQIGNADLAAGAGIINDTTKCLWTKKGQRITLRYRFGSFIASVSKHPDPAKPKAVTDAS